MPESPRVAVVRPFRTEDRAAVRRICHVTGFMGEPADWYWSDEESFADMWTGYYTDREPESAFVGEIGGRVVGYLLGCVDSRKAWNPADVGRRHSFHRGLPFRPGTAGMIWRAGRDFVSDVAHRSGTVRGPFLDSRWPAHLHIDILREGRGSGLGRALIDTWMERLRSLQSPGCHLETLAENAKARAFFTTMGFETFGDPALLPGARARDGSRLHNLVMVRSVHP
ncbi:MAG: GNAT family N-acetyltransferase [Actinomycetota bacterium]|nr:GNAT family N-acetyltransferase [Actinomycetota bacterium]